MANVENKELVPIPPSYKVIMSEVFELKKPLAQELKASFTFVSQKIGREVIIWVRVHASNSNVEGVREVVNGKPISHMELKQKVETSCDELLKVIRELEEESERKKYVRFHRKR